MRWPLDGSPSDDFCGYGCQQAWHVARADELVGYREPWDRPEDFPPGVIPPEAFENGTMARVLPMPSAVVRRLREHLGEGLRVPAPAVASSLGLLQGHEPPAPADGPGLDSEVYPHRWAAEEAAEYVNALAGLAADRQRAALAHVRCTTG